MRKYISNINKTFATVINQNKDNIFDCTKLINWIDFIKKSSNREIIKYITINIY